MKDKPAKPTSKNQQLIVAAICLAGAYGFGSWAIDSGSYWHYLATLLLLGAGIKLCIRAFKK